MRKKSKLNNWNNTYECIEWFEKIEDERNKTFIAWDIVNSELLSKALNWAKQYTAIGDDDINTSLAAPGALAHRLQRRTACNTSPPTLSKMADGVRE